jgi:glycogen(starch) synthase
VLIVISGAIIDVITRQYGVERSRFNLCPLGISLPDVDLCERSPKNKGPMIMFVGTLSRRKGVPLLLRSAAAVLSKYPDARLVLAGKDTASPEGRSFIDEELTALDGHIRERIEIPGFVDDKTLSSLYASADLFVMPSEFESFGQVYLEAMSYRLPVVAMDIPSAREIVVSGQTGLLVQERSPESLAAAMDRLLGNERLRKDMGREGRRRVESEFTVEKMSRRTEAIYLENLKR